MPQLRLGETLSPKNPSIPYETFQAPVYLFSFNVKLIFIPYSM